MENPGRRTTGPVHPRLRGELVENVESTINQGRFIPAYAGNSI